MNTTCSQCGSVLPSGSHGCHFCELPEEFSEKYIPEQKTRAARVSTDTLSVEWRGEVSQRLQAYRAKRRKAGGNDGQTALPFADEPPADQRRAAVGVSVEEPHPPTEADEPKDDFAFTIAIGRPAKKVDPEEEGRMVIDVSLPPLVEESGEAAAATKELTAEPMPLYPVASTH